MPFVFVLRARTCRPKAGGVGLTGAIQELIQVPGTSPCSVVASIYEQRVLFCII
jgi:hypothetical protein